MSNTIDEVIAKTKSSDWRIRRDALSEICPCKVKKDIDAFWNRVFEMAREKDPMQQVRYQVLHTLCDGSPKARETEVVELLQSVFWNDENDKIRRRARRAVTSYVRILETATSCRHISIGLDSDCLLYFS